MNKTGKYSEFSNIKLEDIPGFFKREDNSDSSLSYLYSNFIITLEDLFNVTDNPNYIMSLKNKSLYFSLLYDDVEIDNYVNEIIGSVKLLRYKYLKEEPNFFIGDIKPNKKFTEKRLRRILKRLGFRNIVCSSLIFSRIISKYKGSPDFGLHDLDFVKYLCKITLDEELAKEIIPAIFKWDDIYEELKEKLKILYSLIFAEEYNEEIKNYDIEEKQDLDSKQNGSLDYKNQLDNLKSELNELLSQRSDLTKRINDINMQIGRSIVLSIDDKKVK